MASLRLKVTSGNAGGSILEVDDELVIGREADGEGTLGQDIEMSRKHARIARAQSGAFMIEDLGSTNGTYVNGRRISTPTTVQTGDRIELGSSELVVQVGAIEAEVPLEAEVPVEPEVPVQPEPTDAPAAAAPETPAAAPEVVTAEATAEAEAVPASAKRVSLRVDIDLDGLEATVSLDEGSDEIRLRHDGERWRLAD